MYTVHDSHTVRKDMIVILYIIHCTLYIIQCTMYDVQCIMYNVLSFTMYNVVAITMYNYNAISISISTITYRVNNANQVHRLECSVHLNNINYI